MDFIQLNPNTPFCWVIHWYHPGYVILVGYPIAWHNADNECVGFRQRHDLTLNQVPSIALILTASSIHLHPLSYVQHQPSTVPASAQHCASITPRQRCDLLTLNQVPSIALILTASTTHLHPLSYVQFLPQNYICNHDLTFILPEYVQPRIAHVNCIFCMMPLTGEIPNSEYVVITLQFCIPYHTYSRGDTPSAYLY